MIKLNGQTGQFVLRKVTEGLVEDKQGKKSYPTEDLGKKIQMVFLRIRRKMVEKQEGKLLPGAPRPSYTIEHNTKHDRIVLFAQKGNSVVQEYGTSEELRLRYPMLRTHQIMYVLFRNRVHQLIVKGSSLGSESKAKDVMDFYAYVSSFEKNPNARDSKKDHFFDYKTVLTAVEESGQLGGYYTTAFERGEANTDEEMKTVGAYMKHVHEYVMEYDDYYRDRTMTAMPVSEEPTINYDDEEIEPEEAIDIPDEL